MAEFHVTALTTLCAGGPSIPATTWAVITLVPWAGFLDRRCREVLRIGIGHDVVEIWPVDDDQIGRLADKLRELVDARNPPPNRSLTETDMLIDGEDWIVLTLQKGGAPWSVRAADVRSVRSSGADPKNSVVHAHGVEHVVEEPHALIMKSIAVVEARQKKADRWLVSRDSLDRDCRILASSVVAFYPATWCEKDGTELVLNGGAIVFVLHPPDFVNDVLARAT